MDIREKLANMDLRGLIDEEKLRATLRRIPQVVGIWEITALVIVTFVVYKRWTRDPRLAYLPPHVRGWPIINQTLDHVKDNPIPDVIKWAEQYGEVFCTTSGTTLFIWVNSRKAFKELIDRRSAIYSSRHPQPMVMRASGNRRMVFMPYGRDWRAIRNIIHRLLTPSMSKSYSPIQAFEAKQLSVDLLDTPEDFYMHNRRYSASTIMQVVYGHRIPKCF
jgi:cytochrome P450